MELLVNGAKTYCYTGGKAFDAAKPTVVFIHGVLNDHSVWILQSRYLANHGYNVLAVDLPGHCRSAGEAPSSVEEAADFIAALLDAAGVQKAALVGHSWGSLIALEAAARLKERVTHLVLVGTAFPMKVSPMLIEASLNEPEKALSMVNVFSRSTLAAPPSVLGPAPGFMARVWRSAGGCWPATPLSTCSIGVLWPVTAMPTARWPSRPSPARCCLCWAHKTK